MSHGAITLPFGDKQYKFRIAYAQWEELDALLKVGPVELFQRLLQQRWKARDLREIIRVGLIGGGMSMPEALNLVARYVEARPILEYAPTCLAIMEAALTVPHETETDGATGEAEAATSSTSESTLPQSMETVQ